MQLEDIRIPRFALRPNPIKTQLYAFTDASEKAYAAAVYIRCTDNNGSTVSLLASKTRVAPIKTKTQSLPKLELCPALVYTITILQFFLAPAKTITISLSVLVILILNKLVVVIITTHFVRVVSCVIEIHTHTKLVISRLCQSGRVAYCLHLAAFLIRSL